MPLNCIEEPLLRSFVRSFDDSLYLCSFAELSDDGRNKIVQFRTSLFRILCICMEFLVDELTRAGLRSSGMLRGIGL